jgi:hypothetical protein
MLKLLLFYLNLFENKIITQRNIDTLSTKNLKFKSLLKLGSEKF